MILNHTHLSTDNKSVKIIDKGYGPCSTVLLSVFCHIFITERYYR